MKIKNNVNQLKVGAGLSYISMGLGYLISIIYTPIMLRLLGQSEFGLYNLVASVVAYLGVLNFGFGSAYIRYYSRYKIKEDKKKIATLNGMFFIVFSVIGLIAMIAGTVLAINTDVIFGSELTSFELSKAKTLMIILVINLGFSFPNIIFTSHITANEKFVFQKIVEMIKIIVNPFIILPLLILGYGSVGMVLSTTVLNIIIELINIFYCIKILKMKFSFRNFDVKLMKEMTLFSSFIFINLIIDQINWNVDKIILGRFYGTASVAIYGLAAQLNIYYMSISTTISSVFIPRVHRLVGNTNNNIELTNLFTRIGRIQFIILSLISTGFIFFGKAFIKMWAGNDYENVYYILLVLMITGIMSLIQNIGIEIQRAKNLHKFRSWLYLIIAIVNIAISIPLVKSYGEIGAAIGTGIAILIGNVFIMNWYYQSKVGLDMLYFWKQIFCFIPSLIIPISVGILISFQFNLSNILYFISFCILYTIIFCISMWVFGMNQYEKNLIVAPLKKVLKKVF